MAKIITPLLLKYCDGSRWTLYDDFIVEGKTIGLLRVPKDFETDFNSIPKGLWNIFPPTAYGEASVVHDLLYRYGKVGAHKTAKPVTRAQADNTHQEFMALANPPWWKAHAYHWGLHLGGWVVWNKYRSLDPKP